MARERVAQRLQGVRGEQGPVGEAAGGDVAPPGGALEEGQGAPEGGGVHKAGNDRADELAVAAKKLVDGAR